MQFSDAVIYISEFSKGQFLRRFNSGKAVEHVVCMPSTDITEYATPTSPGTTSNGYLLIVGNAFAHKGLLEAVGSIRKALPLQAIRVLGIKLAEFPDLTSFESGKLDDSVVAALYRQAKAVLFPSYYEGFGFPILHALGNGKVVFARDLPVYQEIKERVAASENIRLFRTNSELIQQLIEANWEWQAPDRNPPDVGWHRSARELEAVLAKAFESSSLEKIEARLSSLDIMIDAFAALDADRRHKAELSEVQNEAALARGQTELALNQIEVIHRSTSWRLTAPLRQLRGILGGP